MYGGIKCDQLWTDYMTLYRAWHAVDLTLASLFLPATVWRMIAVSIPKGRVLVASRSHGFLLHSWNFIDAQFWTLAMFLICALFRVCAQLDPVGLEHIESEQQVTAFLALCT